MWALFPSWLFKSLNVISGNLGDTALALMSPYGLDVIKKKIQKAIPLDLQIAEEKGTLADVSVSFKRSQI